MSLSLKDFQPINRWDVDVNGEKYSRLDPEICINREGSVWKFHSR